MTYQDKYSELYKNVEKSGKALEDALKKISNVNGFGDINVLSNYFRAQKDFAYHSYQFDNLLKYVNEGKVDPNSEFIDREFMYEFIKNDQQKIGADWDGADLYPGQSKQRQFYSCEIGLTNNEIIEKDYQNSIYKFPVVNLNHGKECYTYLSERLQNNPDNIVDIDKLDFSKVIDESKPIFVKVKMRTK